MAGTNFINRIGIHTTAETAIPSIPAEVGSNMADTSGYVTIGRSQGDDDADLDGGSVGVSFMNEKGQVMPPRSLTREDIVLFRNGVDELTFSCYDGRKELFEMASSVEVDSHITKLLDTLTKRTVWVEVNGLWVDYFPNCDVAITGFTGDYEGDEGSVNKTDFIVTPCATATIAGGWWRYNYDQS